MKTLRKILIAGPVAAFFLMSNMAAMATTTNVTGFVDEKGGRYILLTMNDVYVLEGDEVCNDMVGKEIAVTGAVEMENEVKIIDVYIYDEVEE